MPWSCKGHVIPISSYPLLLTKLPIKSLQATCCCYFYLSCTDLNITYSCTDSNITSYTLALALFEKKVLRVLQSQAGLQEKTIYKSALFPSGSAGARDALQKKAIEGATSKVVKRRLAGRDQT